MATTYKVKKGDTLNDIAKTFGTSIDSISGYSSGNKDLITEGENLSIDIPKKDTGLGTSYVDEVKSQLGEISGETPETTSQYDTATLDENLKGYSAKRDESFQAMKDLSTNTFNEEYKTRGLEEKKSKMSELDQQIADKKQERDNYVTTFIKGNPGLSASQMSGQSRNMVELANETINNLIAERNGLATDYNTNLGEIDKIIENKLADKTLDYNYYTGLTKDTESKKSEYMKELREMLQDEVKNDQFDRQLSQALEIAQLKGGDGSGDRTLVKDPKTGDPLYWYNNSTGDIQWIEGEAGPTENGYDAIPTDTETKTQTPGLLSRIWTGLFGGNK